MVHINSQSGNSLSFISEKYDKSSGTSLAKAQIFFIASSEILDTDRSLAMSFLIVYNQLW